MPNTAPIIDGEDLAEVVDLDYADFDDALDQVAQAASDLVQSLIRGAVFDLTARPAAVIEAALSVGSEIWQARTAAGGQAVAVDFSPGAYRVSVYMTRRVHGLLGPYMEVKGLVG